MRALRRSTRSENMAKKINKKLGLKKETLRSLSEQELGAVAGGTFGSDKGLGMVKPPPPATMGCTLDLIQIYNYQFYP